MALDHSIRESLSLPAICAPMFKVTGPSLVREACLAGIVGALPRMNASDLAQFEAWLAEIRSALDLHKETQPSAVIGPIAVNLYAGLPADELRDNLEICRKYGVNIIISVAGDPTELVKHVHGWGGKVFHDVTNLRFAERAIRAGVDGLICIGSGGGGHSGTLSLLSFIPQVRSIFTGTIVLAGAVSNGMVIRAAEIMGADLAYLGTRFIATAEADAPIAYKQMLVEQTSSDLLYTHKVAGAPANWLKTSLQQAGLDPNSLPEPRGHNMRHDHLPPTAHPWVNLWSAGQGIDLIQDIPSVAELVDRLRAEYVAACRLPSMVDAAAGK